MILQFVFNFLATHKYTLTTAVERTSVIFHWNVNAIYPAVRSYLDGDHAKPIITITTPKKSGRGAELFKDRYGDRFMVIKKEHVSEILKCVTSTNQELGGMVTLGHIETQLPACFRWARASWWFIARTIWATWWSC